MPTAEELTVVRTRCVIASVGSRYFLGAPVADRAMMLEACLRWVELHSEAALG